MKPLTEFQRKELIYKLEIRRETVEQDKTSADEFEATPGAIDTLEKKLEAGSTDFTDAEQKWMIEELNDLISIENGNRNHEGIKTEGFINSFENAIIKIERSDFVKLDSDQIASRIEPRGETIIIADVEAGLKATVESALVKLKKDDVRIYVADDSGILAKKDRPPFELKNLEMPFMKPMSRAERRKAKRKNKK